MNRLDELVRQYFYIKGIPPEDEVSRITKLFDFQKELISNSSEEVLDFHYECLRDLSDWQLYSYCRAAFVKRGSSVESYLLEKLKSEGDEHVIGDVIHLLGRLRSSSSLPLALKYIKSDVLYIKDVCLYVIGWVGFRNEISLLSEYLNNGSTPELRITAGSALRQIYWRFPDFGDFILDCLSGSYYLEKNDLVKARVIELMSTISKKNLGIREDKNDPNILLGDLKKAVVKTERFLASRVK
jgi:hypothetical protein